MSKKKKGNEDEKEHRSQMKGTVHASRAVSDKLRATLRSEEPLATRAVRLPPQRLSPCPPPTSLHLSLSPLRALFFPLNCVLATDATPGRRTSNAARNCPTLRSSLFLAIILSSCRHPKLTLALHPHFCLPPPFPFSTSPTRCSALLPRSARPPRSPCALRTCATAAARA